MLTLDGSMGEGGGQILRSALALSMVTGTPFLIEHLRAGREKPGLRRQHLTAVQAAAMICTAHVEGAEIGSQRLSFAPRAVRPGEYRFDTGSAGSVTLVLQTILPALLTASGPSSVQLLGGTHNPQAPPVDFLQKAFLPLVQRMGPAVRLVLKRYGFAPAGGGRCSVTIDPVTRLQPFHLTECGDIRRQSARALVAGLPEHVAERELAVVAKRMRWPPECLHQQNESHAALGAGNVLMLEIESEHVTEVFTAFGKRGVRAETVANTAVEQAKRYLAAEVPVGEYLADQLLLPLALAGSGSFVTMPLSLHAQTNLEVLRQFLEVEIVTREIEKRRWLVEFRSAIR